MINSVTEGNPTSTKNISKILKETAGLNLILMTNGSTGSKSRKPKDYAREHRKFRIRVIKFKKSELKQINDNKKDETVILFTNLDDSEWSTEEIIQLYGNRWSIETGYAVLKTSLR
ncbi:transposase [Coprobacillaceae bacterium CR2/5/TPMF4]|nr:transposase [Coprobacillaceae bacterium CR2/5/TPMF4]